MFCYKDRTFCKESTCKDFNGCPSALTDKVREDARRWMENPPIAQFAVKPDCYKEINNG